MVSILALAEVTMSEEGKVFTYMQSASGTEVSWRPGRGLTLGHCLSPYFRLLSHLSESSSSFCAICLCKLMTYHYGDISREEMTAVKSREKEEGREGKKEGRRERRRETDLSLQTFQRQMAYV